MALKQISLQKIVISNKDSNDRYKKNFDQLAKSSEEFNVEVIKNIYDSVFYKIPKRGNSSHSDIIEQSYNYVYEDINKQKDVKISNLKEELNNLTIQLERLEQPEIKEHPIYGNLTFLKAGDNGVQYQGMDTIYVMQEGVKRVIELEPYYILRKALGLPEDLSGIIYVPVEILNAIDTATPIVNANALNVTQIIGQDIDIQLIAPYYDVFLYCAGNEIQDVYDIYSNEEFYTNEEGCTVKYVFNEFVDEEEVQFYTQGAPLPGGTPDIGTYEIRTLTLAKGETQKIRVARDATADMDSPDMIAGINGIPEPVGYNFGLPTTEFDAAYLSEYGDPQTEPPSYIREWGKDRKFSGIVYVKGRVKYREQAPVNQSGPYLVLNGIGNYNINETTPTFDELSTRGTRKLYSPYLKEYGSLHQTPWIQKNYFDDVAGSYYYTDIANYSENPNTKHLYPGHRNTQGLGKGRYKIYGQPILNNNSGALVLLCVELLSKITGDMLFWFLNITQKRIQPMSRQSAINSFGLDIDYIRDSDLNGLGNTIGNFYLDAITFGLGVSGNNYNRYLGIRRVRWENVRSTSLGGLSFIGLVPEGNEVGVYGYNSDILDLINVSDNERYVNPKGTDNPLNPKGLGSNFGLTQHTKNIVIEQEAGLLVNTLSD